MLTEEKLQELKNAELDWDKAFIASPRSKRCLCLPFNDELNQKYEESLYLEKELIVLLGK